MTPISRRGFLEQGAGLLAAAFSPAPVRQPPASPARRVVVVGAGAAGLCAAYELARAGHEVLVFEAKARPGGRIHTVRAPFADGLYAEAGAMFLGETHHLPLHYAREFGLPLVPVAYRPDLGAVAHLAGQRVETFPGRPVRWPVALGPDEQDQSVHALQRRYHYAKLAEIEGLGGGDWPRASHLPYDALSLAEFWRRQGASEGAVRLMRLRYFDGFGEGVDSVSALAVLHETASYLGGKTAYQIQGGNDLLPRAFAERLGDRIHYGSAVVAIRHDARAVTITVEDRSGRHDIRGDHLVCTLPFPVLRRVVVTPAFSPDRARAIREIDNTSVTRVYVQCRTRFWEAEGFDGSAVTDLPIQQVYHTTTSQGGPRGILEAYTSGARARRLAAMDSDLRLDAVLADMAKVHPRLLAHVEGGASQSWDTDPWALGGFAYLKPGQVREFFPAIQRPEGRIHFAGDLIGGLPGYVQGALLSAQAAASRIAES